MQKRLTSNTAADRLFARSIRARTSKSQAADRNDSTSAASKGATKPAEQKLRQRSPVILGTAVQISAYQKGRRHLVPIVRDCLEYIEQFGIGFPANAFV